MGITDIVLIGIGLAVDSFAISIAAGIAQKKFKPFHVFRMALLFTLFQGLMLAVSYYGASYFKETIISYHYLLAFCILLLLGIKQVREAVKADEIEMDKKDALSCMLWSTAFVLAVATSLDSLPAGVLFVPYEQYDATIIAAYILALSFVLTIMGSILGSCVGNSFDVRVELYGGLLLIGVGCKIFCQYIWFG